MKVRGKNKILFLIVCLFVACAGRESSCCPESLARIAKYADYISQKRADPLLPKVYTKNMLELMELEGVSPFDKPRSRDLKKITELSLEMIEETPWIHLADPKNNNTEFIEVLIDSDKLPKDAPSSLRLLSRLQEHYETKLYIEPRRRSFNNAQYYPGSENGFGFAPLDLFMANDAESLIFHEAHHKLVAESVLEGAPPILSGLLIPKGVHGYFRHSSNGQDPYAQGFLVDEITAFSLNKKKPGTYTEQEKAMQIYRNMKRNARYIFNIALRELKEMRAELTFVEDHGKSKVFSFKFSDSQSKLHEKPEFVMKIPFSSSEAAQIEKASKEEQLKYLHNRVILMKASIPSEE